MSLYNIKGERNSVSFISKLKYEGYKCRGAEGLKEILLPEIGFEHGFREDIL